MEIRNTPCGAIRGVPGKHPGTVAFKGIRYATAGRWECPAEVTRWEGIYDATRYGSCSYQPRAFYNEEENLKKIFYYHEFRKGEHYTYSEDCLFLNIFTPETAKEGDRLPVLVYIHGGGFTGGCGHEKHFDEPVWPTRGVIGVTINYRLGPMGFVTLPQLEEEQEGFAGNYGLYDQLTALKWVRHNIASFGGDPENVTIMGQSAGAMSVQQLLRTPLSRGTFARAVMSSGGGVSSLMPDGDKAKAQAFWTACMEKAGCGSLAAFRALPPEQLFALWQETRKTVKGGNCFPVRDGRFVTGAGPEAGREIPCMAGSTSEDMMPPILQSMARNWCAGGKVPGYTWYFDRRLPGDDNGAWHSSDLWYWFGTLDNCWRPMEDKDRQLSGQMVDYLTNFCKTGDPNGPELPGWKPSGPKQTQVLRLGEGDTRMGKPSLTKMIATMLTNKAVGE